jgi:uncharacterized membrane protein (UPF0127 family)
MRAVRSQALGGFLLTALAVLQFGLPILPASAVQKGKVVIDGRVRIDAEVARSIEEQAKGLGGRSALKKGTGMVFPYDGPGPRAFWMMGMLIPLDILWIRDGKIVAIEAKIPPPFPGKPLAVYSHVADLVLEVPAGYAREMGIRVGQPVRVRYSSASQ